jgi:hypothetical protein
MSFSTMIPATIQELYDNLLQLHENRDHVKSITVDEVDNAIKVDLDAANSLNEIPDAMRIPLKGRHLAQAKEILGRIQSASARGEAPTKLEAGQLFEMVDKARH